MRGSDEKIKHQTKKNLQTTERQNHKSKMGILKREPLKRGTRVLLGVV